MAPISILVGERVVLVFSGHMQHIQMKYTLSDNSATAPGSENAMQFSQKQPWVQ